MANKPELTIKVNVDPYIDPQQVRGTIERKVNTLNETNPPKIKLKPDMTDFQSAITNNLGGPYDVDLKPNLIENIEDKVVAEIGKIDTEKLKIDIKPDLEGFSTQLSETLRDELKEVNQKLSYYLKNLTKNTNSLNDVVNNLFIDSSFAERLQSQMDEVRASFNALKSDLGESNSFFDNIFARTDLKSFNDFQISIAKLKKELEPLYGDDSILADPKTKFYDSSAIKKYFEEILPDVQEFVQLLNNISYVPKNTKLLKELGISSEDMKKTLAEAQVMYSVITKIRNYAEAGNFNADKYNLSEQIENIISKAYDASDINVEDFEGLFQGVIDNVSNVSKLISERLEEVADKKREVLESDGKTKIGGYDENRIKKITDTYLQALSAFTTQQNVLNRAKAVTIRLDDTLLAKASAHARSIKSQASDIQKIYGFVSDDILNSKKSEIVNSKNGDAKNTNSVESNFVVTDVKFNIKPEVLQNNVDTLFSNIKPTIKKFNITDAVADAKKELEGGLSNVKLNNSSLEDASTKVTNETSNNNQAAPINGHVTITDADVVVDVKNPVSIPGIVTVDPTSVQFGNSDDIQKNADALSSVKQSLSKISTSAEDYGTKIAAIGPSVQYVAQEVDNLSHSLENQIIDLDRISEQTNAYIGKAGSISIDTSNAAVTGEPAAITGKVVLSTEDIVSPETPVDIKGHVELKTTDITPPSEPVELQGKISKTTMESVAKGKKKKGQDIEKPEVVELNGHVKLEDKDIERLDPIVMDGKVIVAKDKIKLPEDGIDVKGNLILKNAEIANAIRNATNQKSKKKNNSESTQETTTADKKSTSRKSLISNLITVNKKIAETKNLLEDVSKDEVDTIQKRLESLRANRDEIVKLLNDTNTDSDKWYVDRKFRYANKEVDYTRLRHADSNGVKDTKATINNAKKNYIDAIEQIRKAEEDAANATSEELKTKIAEQKTYYEEQKKNSDAILNSYNEIANELVQEARQEIEVAERKTAIKKLQSSEKAQNKTLSAEERAQKSQTNVLVKSIEDSQYKYSEKKFSGAADVRATLGSAEEAVAKLANIKLGTKEYANALEDANSK